MDFYYNMGIRVNFAVFEEGLVVVRERRNKEKLVSYYNKFMNEGIVDPNVHPWIAASWQRCRQMRLPHEVMNPIKKLTRAEVAQHLKKHAMVLGYLERLYEQTKQHLNMHNLSMLLIDNEGYVVKNYAMPFFQRSIENIQGMRVLEQDVGTSSVSIALEHNTPFLMFGPEMWIRDCHSGDACSAPIFVNGKLRYVLTFFSMETKNLPYDLLLNHLLTMKYAIEQHLTMLEQKVVNDILMAQLPAAVFCLDRDGNIKYCNAKARERMEGRSRFQDIFLNYEHIPIRPALNGQSTLHKELTWITQDKAYEDVTSVLPIDTGSEITGALIVSMSIEDLKTTIAHATGYSSRYSLYSMVGESEVFQTLQHKAGRLAKTNRNILLQGEPGTGKQRLAHGIHQLSDRAAAPLISVKCKGDSKYMHEELFGCREKNRNVQGKLELVSGGTLFVDEVEKMPSDIGDELADYLAGNKRKNIRLIAACDSNLKKLTDKKLFSSKLFDIVMATVLKVPSLGDRPEDIEIISNHILREMSLHYNVPPKKLTDEALEVLMKGEWPGNIKQLQGVIEKAFFHTSSSMIGADDIRVPDKKESEKSWKYDKDVFVAAWKSAGGNISRLSQILGVSRVTLYRYLHKYNLDV